MTHILIMSGSATGGPVPRTLELDLFSNLTTSDAVLLQYVERDELTLDRHTNVSTFDDVEIEVVIITQLTLDTYTNTNTFDDIALENLPFDPENTETEDLLAEVTGDYPTTRKIQIDALISELKTAGVWSKLDWFCGAMFMANEHDSLLDWTQPTRSLVKVLTPTYTPYGDWQGMTALNNSKLKSGWQPTDGPNATLTSFALFIRVNSTAAENNLQLAGSWNRSAGPGPTAPEGTFITLNAVTGTWDAGANVNAFDGVSGAALTGVPATFAVTRNGTAVAAVRDGVVVASDTAATTKNRTHADGLSILGSATGLSAGRAFNGTISYGGWGGYLTPSELAAVDAAVVTALLPPSTISGVWLLDDDNNYLANAADDYVETDGP